MEDFLRNRWLKSLAAVLPPLLLVIAWHAANQAYPLAVDDSEYLQTAMRNLRAFEVGGSFGHGLKPVLLPVLAVPFVLLSKGKVLVAITLANSFFFLVFLSYLYLLFGSFAAYGPALLGVWTIGTVPWILGTATRFLTELPLMMAIVAAVYHFERSNFFRHFRQSLFAGLWTGLALCLRPVEGALILGLGATVFAVAAWRENGGKPTPPFWAALGVSLGSALVWYLPSARSLYDWVYSNSFGANTIRGGQQPGALGWRLFRDAFRTQLGVDFLWLLAALSAVAAASKADRAAMSEVFKQRWRVLAAVAMGLVYLTIGSFGKSDEPRYYAGNMMILLVALTALALKTRAARLLLPLPLLHAAFVFNVLQDPIANGYVAEKGNRVPRMTWEFKADPANPLYAQLHQAIGAKGPLRFAVLQTFSEAACSNLVAPSLLYVQAYEAGRFWDFSDVDEWDKIQQPDQLLRLFQGEFDYVIVGPVEREAKDLSEASSRVFTDLVEAKRAGRLSEKGFESVAELRCPFDPGLRFFVLKNSAR